MNILFIEDNPLFYNPASELLEDQGFTIKVVPSANQFVELQDNLGGYDLVLIDSMLRLGSKIKSSEAPETGVAIFRRVRMKHPFMPVIFLSALSREELSTMVTFDEKTGYHPKPIPKDPSALITLIRNVAKRH
jgi:DNA-binding response OmpR family regulator